MPHQSIIYWSLKINIIIFKMYRLLFSIFLVVLVYSQVALRLNTKQTSKLNVDSSITSTLGLFRATLRKTKCSLDISYFNDTTYVPKGTYSSPNITQDCAFLQVIEGALVTSQNQTFMYVGDFFNESTIFTIDDLGVMRLIGSYIKLNRVDQQSFETSVTQFYTAHKYVYAGSQLNVRFQNSYGPLLNDNGWGFMAQFGQLDLYFDQDPNKTASYVYSRFKFNNSQIQDFNSDTFPAAIFSNITFEPRCFEPRVYINFKAPYLIIADQYFPKVTVMEQGGYKVFEFMYAKKSEFTFQQEKQDIHYWRQFSLCPDETFEHKGQCLTQCPAPYLHEMRGRAGTCRLVCEEFTPIDLQNRICTCMSNYEAPKYNSEMIKTCPNDTAKYPYGCYCKTAGKSFDKKISYSCVDTCPSTTFAHQGLCVNCPNNCLTCGIDSFHRMFLECKVCQPGYKLNDGQCFKECNSNLGFTMAANGTCLKCTDGNCVSCPNDPAVCLKCNILYTLSNGTCLQSCPVNTTLVPASFFDSQCLASEKTVCNVFLTSNYKSKPFLKCDQCVNPKSIPHLAGCVTTCPAGYKRYENITGFFYCSCKEGRTIDNECLNISGCPIKMYYDIYSDSCLSCPFGCISCRGSICTSCYPGYFLYVSPQAIICRRKSPLFACNDQYALWNDICLVTDFQNLQMALCRTNIPNCRVCPFKAEFRATVCVVCELGFYLHENKCLSACPPGTIPYANSVCALTEIPNCAMPHLQSQRQASILNITLIEKNKAYGYYIYSNTQYANDPVGYIPYFQKITSSRRLTDGLYRENSFFEPEWVCLKCDDGYGLEEGLKKCVPCPKPCITCYLASNNSCLTKKEPQKPIENNGTSNNTNNNTNNNTSNNTNQTTGCQGYIEYTTKQCLKSCNSTNSYPQFQNDTLYCKVASESKVQDYTRVDSATYEQPDGTYVTYFVLENQMSAETSVNIRIQKPAYSTSRLLEQNGQFSANSHSTQHTNRLLQAYYQKVVPIIDRRYIQVVTAKGQSIVIANFTSSIVKMGSVEGYYPPNLVYGSAAQNTHPEFMKTWLAIIGQIMGVVVVTMHCIYVGNELLYKMDNLIILAQTIYYFSFVKILVGRLLAQFYYGWIFTHLGFFPNFFTTPTQYRQNQAPISYKLATTDANFIRNAGFSISIFLVFIGSWALVTGVTYLISKKLHKKQLWYPSLAKSSLIAGIQIFSMNIMYWAIAHFMYRGGCLNCDDGYHKGSLAWAIIFTILICGYTIGRFFFNLIGGLYMFKRVLIAVILPAAFDDLRIMAPLLILELVFVVLRFVIERPELAKEKISILVEFGAALLCYLLLFLCTNSGVNTIIISVVMFFYIVILMSDFMEVYLESRNEWEVQQSKQNPKEIMEKRQANERQKEMKQLPSVRKSEMHRQRSDQGY